MNQTSSQITAITIHDQNLIVVAGAGSGKTYVLVNRYLALLDAHQDWPLNALVAITFTRKAAQEMRERVRLALEKRLYDAVNERERDCWAGRIGAMDSARIDTIHGLCASILRANAAEVGVDPRFEVLDEVDARLLLDDVLDDVLKAVVVQNDPALRLLTEYESYQVRKTLAQLMEAELPAAPPDDLLAHWRDLWGQKCALVFDDLAATEQFHSVIDEQFDGYQPGTDKLADSWVESQRLLHHFQSQGDLETRFSLLSDVRNKIKLTVGSAKFWGSTDDVATAKALLGAFRNALDAAFKEIGAPLTALDARAAEFVPLWHHLARRTKEAYQAAKERDALLDFGDLETLTRSLLLDNPAVRARYSAAEFQHVLVDEFQDTNAAQWDIVRMLAEPDRPGSLFVVGDAKQSIYAFRGADVSVFQHVRAEIVKRGGRDVPLARSFRTHKPLVDGFNHVFGRLLVKTPSSPVSDYEIELDGGMEAERIQPPAGELPPLELLLIDAGYYEKGDDDRSTKCRQWEAAAIAERIHQMVSEGRPVYDKKLNIVRPMRYDDVALLFQSMKQVTLYEDVFKARALPFVTVAGRGYYGRQEVWDLLNLLKALHNPADNLALASALRSPLFSFSDEMLLALRLQRDANNNRLSLWDALQQAAASPSAEAASDWGDAHRILTRLHGLAGRVTIAELISLALEETGYLAVLTGLPDGARRRGNVEKLLDKARLGGQVTLGAFTRYLQDLSDSEVREGEALVEVEGAVTIMTVHASKGLEFPVVVIADASWTKGGGQASPAAICDPVSGLACKVYDADEDKLVPSWLYNRLNTLNTLREEAESKRRLYVAATRAQDYLLISGQIKEKESGWKLSGWLGLLWQGLELEERDFSPQPGAWSLAYDWGSLAITIPAQPPDDDDLLPHPPSSSAWDDAAVLAAQPLSGAPAEPALLRPVRVDRSNIARHLTATQLADLGSVEYDPFYRDRFRRSVLRDAPARVEDVSSRVSGVSSRIIGEIVHQALNSWRFPTESANLEAALLSYAWEQGVIDEDQQHYAVQEARKLIQRFMTSQTYHWLNEAARVLRELPFVFRTEARTIHGVLDVLFERMDGSWAVLDYKSSLVRGYDGSLRALEDHARRYHLQVGVYAAAVREQLGSAPDVYIHYIRYGQTVHIRSGEWELALGKIESYIGNLLAESDWVT